MLGDRGCTRTGELQRSTVDDTILSCFEVCFAILECVLLFECHFDCVSAIVRISQHPFLHSVNLHSMFDGDSDASSADSHLGSLCHLCEELVTKTAWTKFAGKSFHSACNTALRSRLAGHENFR